MENIVIEDMAHYLMSFTHDPVLALIGLVFIIKTLALPIDLYLLKTKQELRAHYLQHKNETKPELKKIIQSNPKTISLLIIGILSQITISLFVLVGLSNLELKGSLNMDWMWWFPSLSLQDPYFFWPAMFFIFSALFIYLDSFYKSEKASILKYLTPCAFTVIMTFFSVKFVVFLCVHFLYKSIALYISNRNNENATLTITIVAD